MNAFVAMNTCAHGPRACPAPFHEIAFVSAPGGTVCGISADVTGHWNPRTAPMQNNAA